MNFTQWAMNLDVWRDTFNNWVSALIGNGGLLSGPLIAWLGITIVGMIVYQARGFLSRLFNAPHVRNNRVEFAGVQGATWGTDKETDDLLEMGNYQKLSGKAHTDEFVSIDEEGHEQSKIKVTRWSGD